MKVAARLEARSQNSRGEVASRAPSGRLMPPGGAGGPALELGEREMLLALLGKIEAAVLDEEAALPRETAARSDEGDQRAA
jgi:hypothetical protein